MQRKKHARPEAARKFSYDDEVARWWRDRANDPAHRRAYRNIADFIRDSFPRPPRRIVDYACGAGHLLTLLSRRFADSKLLGLDGSSLLLGLALRRISKLPRQCSRRISLIKTPLPAPNLPRGCADLVVFSFPNMMPFPGPGGRIETLPLSKTDREIAGRLSLAAGLPDVAGEDPRIIRENLMLGRCISRNLRRLLAPGGICIRAEYATTQRHEWTGPELQRVCFEEGTLDAAVEGAAPRQWFSVLASAYFRSRVLEDVYQQTGDRRDRNGGYLLTVLRAV